MAYFPNLAKRLQSWRKDEISSFNDALRDVKVGEFLTDWIVDEVLPSDDVDRLFDLSPSERLPEDIRHRCAQLHAEAVAEFIAGQDELLHRLWFVPDAREIRVLTNWRRSFQPLVGRRGTLRVFADGVSQSMDNRSTVKYDDADAYKPVVDGLNRCEPFMATLCRFIEQGNEIDSVFSPSYQLPKLTPLRGSGAQNRRSLTLTLNRLGYHMKAEPSENPMKQVVTIKRILK